MQIINGDIIYQGTRSIGYHGGEFVQLTDEDGTCMSVDIISLCRAYEVVALDLERRGTSIDAYVEHLKARSRANGVNQ